MIMTVIKHLITLPQRPFHTRPRTSFALWLIWNITLFILSSVPSVLAPPTPVVNFDKVLHFGYFACGAFLFSSFLLAKKNLLSIKQVFITTTITGSLIGLSDEFHQHFIPGRSGNDPFDLLADVLGTMCAGLYTIFAFAYIKKKNSDNR